MNVTQLEAIVLAAVDHALKKHPVEDNRVELKAEWPDVDRVRQLAGAANRAKGQPVIYVIGIDEKAAKLVPVLDPGFAEWWAKLQARFDEVSPDLVNHFSVNVSATEQVTVLEFDTSRVPYVVKSPGGGSPEREVPIRDGTRTRSANRNDLIRLLAPEATVPNVTVLEAGMNGTWRAATPRDGQHPESSPSTSLYGSIELFIEQSPGATPVMLPSHDMRYTLKSGNEVHTGAAEVWSDSRDATPVTFGVERRQDGVILTGPGRVDVRFGFETKDDSRSRFRSIETWDLSIELGVTGASSPLNVTTKLDLTQARDKSFAFDSENYQRFADWHRA